MYHSISDDPENGIHPYYRINTSPKVFAQHMKFLYENNYAVISLSEAVRLISSSPESELSIEPNQLNELNEPNKLNKLDEPNQPRDLSFASNLKPPTSNDKGQLNQLNELNKPNKLNKLDEPNQPNELNELNKLNTVVLTFDDGYKDFLTQAFPILNKYGFSATVFLPTSFIDSAGKPGLKGKDHLSWDGVRELREGGIAFGSHTVSHRQLRILSRAEIEYEIKKSKEVIEKDLGQNVESFCYPYKFMEQAKEFVRMMKTVLIDAGYESAVTTRIGTANTEDDVFALKRIPVNSDDGGQFFKAKLEGSYDWLYPLQCVSKYITT
jgi:peptidoglycan/xylan/chitin deacetylase (PgdA/CDA1 family)